MRVGSLGESDLPVKTGPGLIGPEHILQRHHVRSRFDSFKVHLGQLVDMVKDRGKLPGEGVDFFLAQSQAGKPGDMKYLLALNHEAESTGGAAGASAR